MPQDSETDGSHFSALDEPLIRWRCVEHGDLHRSSLPQLLAVMAADRVRDFPALRPHQRHPWHAFLTQLGAIALHRAGESEPWADTPHWRSALLALTPDDLDGAAWCLVAPTDRPALLQPPVPGEKVADWKNLLHAADELDMLVTSKNHDLKGARARRGEPDDWIFALVSLQTQEGFLGAGNYGISRMNGGFASRPGVGVAALGTRVNPALNDGQPYTTANLDVEGVQRFHLALLGIDHRKPSPGCPARAGIGPSECLPRSQPDGLPRASGDRPWSAAVSIAMRRVAPRERG